MTITYTIVEEDYLTYQLFSASKNKLVSRKRKRNWFLLPILYAVFSAASYYYGNQKSISLVFAIMAGFWLISYPFYARWLYKNHYKKHVKQNNKEMFGRTVTLNLQDSAFEITDEENMSKVSLNEVMQLYEIKTHVFIRLKSGSSLIIPKKSVNDIKGLAKIVTKISKQTKIQLIKELEWKWK